MNYLFFTPSSLGEASIESVDFFSLLLSLFFPDGVLDFLSLGDFGDFDRLDRGLSPDLGVFGGSSGAGGVGAVSLAGLSGESGLSTANWNINNYPLNITHLLIVHYHANNILLKEQFWLQ